MSEEKNDFEELRSFIAGSLTAILEGISDAQNRATLDSPFKSGVHSYNAPKEVDFDVAVSAEHATSKKGGFSLRVMSVGADAGAEGSKQNTTATRIRFTVRTEFKRHDSGKDMDLSKVGTRS